VVKKLSHIKDIVLVQLAMAWEVKKPGNVLPVKVEV
jgi:hypothetical protein